MIVMTAGVAVIGYGIAIGFRYYVKLQRDGLLHAPVDLGM